MDVPTDGQAEEVKVQKKREIMTSNTEKGQMRIRRGEVDMQQKQNI